MQTALTLLGVMTAHAQLVTLEMGIYVMVCQYTYHFCALCNKCCTCCLQHRF